MNQYDNLPGDERAALLAIADAGTQEQREQAMLEYCRLRQVKRRYQHRRGQEDRYKRTMLAVHVPFEYAQEVAARADREGMSVYAWLRRAIDAAMT